MSLNPSDLVFPKDTAALLSVFFGGEKKGAAKKKKKEKKEFTVQLQNESPFS